jgi:hypothetical protein
MKPLQIEMKTTKEQIVEEIKEELRCCRRVRVFIGEDGFLHSYYYDNYPEAYMGAKLILLDTTLDDVDEEDVSLDWVEQAIAEERVYLRENDELEVSLLWPV